MNQTYYTDPTQISGFVENAPNGYSTFLGAIDNFFTGNADWKRSQIVSAQNAYQSQLARASNSAEAQKARDFNMTEAQKARDFSERMANTAYQRQVADMKSAGLNPYLSYGSHGSPSPSGPSASGPSASSGFSSGSVGGQGRFNIFDALKSVSSAFKEANVNASARAAAVVTDKALRQGVSAYKTGKAIEAMFRKMIFKK